MENRFHLKWESVLVKWELVGRGGEKEVDKTEVSIVEILKMNSSIMAKFDMAKNFI